MNASLLVFVILGVTVANAVVRYSVHSTTVSFFKALTECSSKGGYLAMIQSKDENDEVKKAIKKAGGTGAHWLGGTDNGIEGAWIWISRNKPVGSLDGYTNFNSGEPNNAGSNGENCLSIDSNFVWNDLPCDLTLPYVCEYDLL
ncbi:perlucin-like [Anopheles nili]|uniref:perlucin-like n=1 Tax=Anopheles nili TaxID=185578 RepID=UPI00237AF125|nr:perlucin-like [Anopheles nili]